MIIRSICLFLFCLAIPGTAIAKEIKQYVIGFYNVENLFDTQDAAGKEDEDFTPAGKYRYTNEIYKKKLHNIATVFKGMGKDTDALAFIGLAEVENDVVLTDLCAQPEIKKQGYKYVWYDGQDIRGIDVALLYDPRQFSVKQSCSIPVYIKDDKYNDPTRNILLVNGILAGENVFVLVNHWPSRREGQQITSAKRKFLANINKRIADSIIALKPDARIVIMGDLNDNPTNESINTLLANNTQKLYNPWKDIYLQGKGTCRYKQQWQLYDQIIISSSLLQNIPGKLHFKRSEIYNPKILQDKYSKLKGAPYRSFKGTYWINGYSDHFPVLLYFEK